MESAAGGNSAACGAGRECDMLNCVDQPAAYSGRLLMTRASDMREGMMAAWHSIARVGLALALGSGLGIRIVAPVPADAQAQSVPVSEVPFYAEWAASPHADAKSEEFTHWNSDGTIPVPCSRCHSTPGFRAYIGLDGGTAGVPRPAPTGTVITCIACHNEKTATLASVTFPSGIKVDHLGPSARCMTCHQGLESTSSVNKALEGLRPDEIAPKLEFINVHYRAAGATLLGNQVKIGYQYPGKVYKGRFAHPAPYNNCIACHNQHSTAVRVTECTTCHTNVAGREDLSRIRVTKTDYDGAGNTSEGMAQVVAHLEDRLHAAILVYARQVAGKPIVYDAEEFPYFFVDTNGNGKVDPGEAKFPNRYKSWTPRLMKAAYNYQFAIKDPGAFAHNAPYVIELLEDSITDLAAKVKIDTAGMIRP
jgi:hypothetical protein